MTHRYFQNQFAGADDTVQTTQPKLKEEFDEDRVHYVVPFLDDQ